MIRLAASGLALLALAGCGTPALIGGLAGGAALGGGITAIGGGGGLATALQIAQAAPVILSDAAKIACAGQQLANQLGAATATGGDAAASARFATISKYLGAACSW